MTDKAAKHDCCYQDIIYTADMTTIGTRYNIPDDLWEKAVDEIQAILIDRAKKPYDDAVITYANLAKEVRSVKLEPPYHALADMLGDVTVQNARRKILMSSLVYNENEGIPGNGFYRLVGRESEFGYDISDQDSYEKKADFATEQQKAVVAYWNSEPTITAN